MTAHISSDDSQRVGGSREAKDVKDQPEWANGLRRLYDSVVEEPLPDSFNDLLSQLDTKA